jgi:parvulin-like peptidyl-prolyl isomerase
VLTPAKQPALTVGQVSIDAASVAAVASAKKSSPAEAIDALTVDALLAEEAEQRGLPAQQPTAWALRAAKARSSARHIHEQAGADRLPSDEELRILSERYAPEVDRAESVLTVHALVARPKKDDKVPQAKALAAKLLGAVTGASSDDDFQTRARTITEPGLEVVVQPLPPFDAKGLISGGAGQMDEQFAAAAFTLAQPGAQSGIVESSFGWHIIRLVERRPAYVMPIEERRIKFAGKAFEMRGKALLDERMRALKGPNKVEILPAAEGFMQIVIGAKQTP